MVREKLYLRPDEVKRLKDLQDDMDWLTEEIRRAEYVGIDIAELKERFNKTKNIRARMLEEYVK